MEKRDHQETMAQKEMLVRMEFKGMLDQEDQLECKDSMDHQVLQEVKDLPVLKEPVDRLDQLVLPVSQAHQVFLDWPEQKENQVLWDDAGIWERQEKEGSLENKELLETKDTKDLQEETDK